MTKWLNALGIAVMLLLMVSGVLIYAAPHFGWQADGLRSGSMSPALKRGMLVVAMPVESATIKTGDIIIYRPASSAENLICHRVIAIENPPLFFKTKGDALAFADPEMVPSQNVVAKVVFDVAILGYAAMFMKTPIGFLLSLAVPGLFIIVLCLSRIRSELPANRKLKSKT